MGVPRIVKRYANRKLYDTVSSRYVTLDQIADLIRSGEDVKILDNTTKEDLTSITLAQIIFEEEKRQRSFLPLSAMRNIIQSGGERIEELVNQAQRRVNGVFGRRGEGAAAEGSTGAGADDVGDAAGPLHDLREWLQTSQRTLDEFQRRVDERVRHAALGALSPLSREVASLAERLRVLEQRLADDDRAAGPAGPDQKSSDSDIA